MPIKWIHYSSEKKDKTQVQQAYWTAQSFLLDLEVANETSRVETLGWLSPCMPYRRAYPALTAMACRSIRLITHSSEVRTAGAAERRRSGSGVGWQTSNAPLQKFRDHYQLILCFSLICCSLGRPEATAPSQMGIPFPQSVKATGTAMGTSAVTYYCWSKHNCNSEAYISVSQSGFSCCHILYLSKRKVILLCL